MNHQVSIAGQTGNANHFELSGDHFNYADLSSIDTQATDVGVAHFDQQASTCLSSIDEVPADHLSTVGGQSVSATHAAAAADHPSTSEGQHEPDTQSTRSDAHPSTSEGLSLTENQDEPADAHLQEPAGRSIFANHNANTSGFDHPEGDGHLQYDTHFVDAEAFTPNFRDQEAIARIKTLYKQRNDIIRAHGNLTRQVISICYHAVGYNTFLEEKQRAAAMKAGNRLLADLKAGNPESAVVFDSAGYLLQVIENAGFDKQKRTIEKKMECAVKTLGMQDFIAQTLGFSAVQLANIIGEAGDIANYGTVSRLWKRMGLAVIDGVRQSKQADKGKALDHGYNPSRRSAMWNVGETIIKAQVRNPKGEDGKPIGSAFAIGYLGQVYLDRKADYAARHVEKTKAHIHNDAKRYMEKRLLKMLWRYWNTEQGGGDAGQMKEEV